MQAYIRITCTYFIIYHVLLSITSPVYKHHVKRVDAVGSSMLAQLSEYVFGGRVQADQRLCQTQIMVYYANLRLAATSRARLLASMVC
jgi:hypothetical protein